MAEGLFFEADNPNLSTRLRFASKSVFTIFTDRQLHYKLCPTEAEADKWSGLQMGSAGEDIYRWRLSAGRS